MYNPTYNRDKKGSFDKNNNFVSIFAGTDAYLIEDELNEMQWIQNENRASFIRKLVSSGFHSKGQIIELGNSNLNSFQLNKSIVLLNGYEILISNNKLRNDDQNTITLPNPPLSGNRKDLVFLEVWFQEIKGSDNLHNLGGVESGILTNKVLDNRYGVETSRRVQLKWRIRTVENVNTTLFPNGVDDNSAVSAWGGNNSNTGYIFTKSQEDEGLFIAGSGNNADKTALKSIDGYSYAIPMFTVDRFNTSAYNSSTNPNGAPTYVNGSSTSTRPDGKFNNVIYLEQIKDIRFQSESNLLKNFSLMNDKFVFKQDLSIEGDLVVNGTMTTINAQELNISDNIIRLNSDFSGPSPTENAGIEVERGGLPNTMIRWNESTDKWEATLNGTNFYEIILSFEKNTPNGIAALDSNSKIAYAQLPTLIKPSTLVVSKTVGVGDFQTIQEAINALPSTGGKIIVREGTYSENLTLKSNMIVEGQGSSSIIKMNNNANLNELVMGDSVKDVILKNVKIDVNKANQTSGKNIAISLFSCENVVIKDVSIENANESGIKLDSTFFSSVLNCNVSGVTGIGIYNFGDPTASGLDGNNINFNKIKNCGVGIELSANSSFNIATNNMIRSCSSGVVNSGIDNEIYNNSIRP